MYLLSSTFCFIPFSITISNTREKLFRTTKLNRKNLTIIKDYSFLLNKVIRKTKYNGRNYYYC